MDCVIRKKKSNTYIFVLHFKSIMLKIQTILKYRKINIITHSYYTQLKYKFEHDYICFN